MLHGLLTLLLSAAPPASPDTLVVCPRLMHDAIRPWIAYREAQGHRIALLAPPATATELRDVIRERVRSGSVRFVLLLGDAEPGSERNVALQWRCVPTYQQVAKVNVRWGSEPQLGTDNYYADVDDDGAPDVALGRLTADSPQELRTMIDKIVRYEQASPHGDWCGRINLVAGVGGFGMLVDSVIETAAKRFITDGIPSSYRTSLTYGSWQSPYCPDPREFRSTTIARLNEGCLFWVYMGHGQRTFLDFVRVPGTAYPILSVADMAHLDCQQGMPIAVFLACYTAAFDQPKDCLAEEMLRAAGGPVAVLGGTRVTMPYGMSVLGKSLMREYFQEQRATLGELVLHAKRQMMAPDIDRRTDVSLRLLDSLAALIHTSPEMVQEERREHVALFQLLGDPLLRLHYPHALQLAVPPRAEAGTTVEVETDCPLGGECTVELVCRRDRTKTKIAGRDRWEMTEASLQAHRTAYQQANDVRWTAQAFAFPGGKLQRRLEIPADAHGDCHIRVLINGAREFAVGSADISIQPAGLRMARPMPMAGGVQR